MASKEVAYANQHANSKYVEVTVYDTKKKPVSNIIVYLEPLARQTLKPSSELVTVFQHNKTFSPYITVSQTQSEVNFINQDDITHQIYSINRHNKFSFKLRPGEKHTSKKFTQKAEIAMGCNIHDWMSGHLLVVDTPYFGKTNNNGKKSFLLDKAGLYRVIIWHPQLPTDNNRIFEEHHITDDSKLTFYLPKKLKKIPKQENTNDFDFEY